MRLRTAVALLGFLVVGSVSPVAARASTSVAPCPRFADPSKTVAALRTCSPTQLNALYAQLTAGPMPGWGVDSHAYARPLGGVNSRYEPIGFAWGQLWQGQDFYTHSQGGYLLNRYMGTHEGFWAPVFYGTSYVDGRPSIVVTYYNDEFFFIRLELRQVQVGVYFGSAMESKYRFREAYVIEDFTNPDVDFGLDCLLCPRGL